jgi:hypothetical protein
MAGASERPGQEGQIPAPMVVGRRACAASGHTTVGRLQLVAPGDGSRGAEAAFAGRVSARPSPAAAGCTLDEVDHHTVGKRLEAAGGSTTM